MFHMFSILNLGSYVHKLISLTKDQLQTYPFRKVGTKAITLYVILTGGAPREGAAREADACVGQKAADEQRRHHE